MATIKSGAGGTTLTVDSGSNAARVTLYDVNGSAVRPTPTGTYMAPVSMRFTGTTASGSSVWSIRAGASLSVYIRRIFLAAAFDGTAAATSAFYELHRFGTATPSGGTAGTVIKKDNLYGGSTLADFRQSATGGALTVTSVVFETALASLVNPRGATGGSCVMNVDFTTSPESRPFLVLAPNEGLAIQIAATAVVGDGLAGFIEWDER